jgi:protein TonB
MKPTKTTATCVVPVRATQAVRWPEGARASRQFATSAGAATLLHVAICAVVLTGVHRPPLPEPRDERTVALLFVAPTSSSPAPPSPAPVVSAAPPRSPGVTEPPVIVPVPAAVFRPPAVPMRAAEDTPSPEPQPRVPAETVKTPRTARPIARPPVIHKAAPQGGAIQKPHNSETPTRAETSNLAETPTEAPQAYAPTGPPTPSPAAAETPIPTAWREALAAWFARHKHYPDQARRNGDEGSVMLRFTVDRSGHVLDVRLLSSTGSSILDAAAQEMLRHASLPPLPPDMAQDRVTITVKTHYALTD